MAAKRKRKSTGPKKTIKMSGSNFKHQLCGNKTDMKKKAEALRKRGFTARVVKNGKKSCLYKGPKSKQGKKR